MIDILGSALHRSASGTLGIATVKERLRRLLTRLMRSCVLVLCLSLAATVVAGEAPQRSNATGLPSGQLTFRPPDPLNATAFDHFYNLDYDRAVQGFQQVLDRHPDDPFALNHLLTAVLH